MTSIDTIDHGWHQTPLNQSVNEKHSVATWKTVFHLMKDGVVSVVLRPIATTPDWTMSIWFTKGILFALRLLTAQRKNNHPLWDDNSDVWTAPNTGLQDNKTRIVPGTFVRPRYDIGQFVVRVQSSITIKARIDHGTIIDYGAYIGCCAFVGQHCHISANATIDGVVAPLNEQPIIIKDTIFFGTGCHGVESGPVEKHRMMSSGALLTGRTKTIDRTTKTTMVGVHLPILLVSLDPITPITMDWVYNAPSSQRKRTKTVQQQQKSIHS